MQAPKHLGEGLLPPSLPSAHLLCEDQGSLLARPSALVTPSRLHFQFHSPLPPRTSHLAAVHRAAIHLAACHRIMPAAHAQVTSPSNRPANRNENFARCCRTYASPRFPCRIFVTHLPPVGLPGPQPQTGSSSSPWQRPLYLLRLHSGIARHLARRNSSPGFAVTSPPASPASANPSRISPPCPHPLEGGIERDKESWKKSLFSDRGAWTGCRQLADHCIPLARRLFISLVCHACTPASPVQSETCQEDPRICAGTHLRRHDPHVLKRSSYRNGPCVAAMDGRWISSEADAH